MIKLMKLPETFRLFVLFGTHILSVYVRHFNVAPLPVIFNESFITNTRKKIIY